MNKFDPIVTEALSLAQSEALKEKHSELDALHLLWGLLEHPQSHFSKAFKSDKKSVTKMIKEELDKLPRLSSSGSELRSSSSLSEWITHSSSHAIREGRQEVSERDLLKFAPQTFSKLNLDYSKLKNISEEDPDSEVPTFLTNLNELAQEGKIDPVIGRAKEIRAVMEVLGRRGKNNPVLVGPAGVGKTAIVEGLANAIVKEEVPEVLKGKTIYSLEMGSLMAGTKYRGEFEERLQKLIKFVKSRSHEIILFIDELHLLVGAGKTEGAMDASNLLKPALARGELNCIGATTNNEYQKYILKDQALDRRFRSIPVNEPSPQDSIEILMGLKEKMEIHHGVKISDEAIFSCVFLSDQYITNKNLPDKAIDLIDEAASAIKISAETMPAFLVDLEAQIRTKKITAQVEKDQKLDNEIIELQKDFDRQKEAWDSKVLSLKKTSELKNKIDQYKFELDQALRNQDYENASKLKHQIIPEAEAELAKLDSHWVLSKKDVANIIHRQTGIPVDKILQSKQEEILKIGDYLKAQVYGQEEALNEIAEVLISSHAGLTDPTRPLGSFLLKGPSGVGKTETAKAISRFLFDSEKNLIRLDMSEYSEKHSVSKLIGSPAGYVGYEEGGVLTEAVRVNPYSIILFDEIEKAHFDFSDILLQILDDGRLTDNKGRTIDFKNTIILLTTNSKDIEQDFKPEVIGRLDAVCNYQALGIDVMNDLVKRELLQLNKRLEPRKIVVSLDNALESRIIDLGYDERYGARPLNGVFNRLVTRALSKKILANSEPELTETKKWQATLEAGGEVNFKELS